MIKFEDITFIIPTNKQVVKTKESIPKECNVIECREFKQGKARNTGLKKATTEWISFVDDDIKFTSEWLNNTLQIAENNPNSIIGLQGYYPSPYLISRFILFNRRVYEDIGLLKETRHGEETEWLMRAVENGYRLIGLPRESVYHYPHKKGEFKHEIKNILWLLWLHPTFPFRILKSIVYKIEKSSYDSEYQKIKEI